MYKIKKLTPKQEALLPVYRDKWIDIGLCTEPADRPAAEEGITQIYKIAGLRPPSKIVWYNSPVSMISAKAIQGSVGDSVWNSVWNSVGGSVGDSVWNSVWNSVGGSVGDSVWNSVGDSVWNSVGGSVRECLYGQHDAYWLCFYDFFNQVCGLKKQTQKLSGLWLLAKSAGWAVPSKNICWISERHNILLRDHEGRLHNLNGPALTYPDGWEIYAVHGVRVPKWIIKEPLKISVKSIDTESNAEIRRVMIDQYGQGKYLIDSGIKSIHQDEFGTLFLKEIPNDEPLVMVKVVNVSMETNGGFKEYFLRVPPDIRTAKEAVAWTFGQKQEDYSPISQS